MGALALLLAAAVASVPPPLVPLRQSPNCQGARFCPGDRDPQWSPDGNWIAFVRRVPAPLGSQGQFRLLLRNTRNGRTRPVLEPGPTPRTGVWSPDSTRLAREGGIVVDVRTGSSTRVIPTDVLATNAVWSSDGRRLALTRYSASRFGPGWCCQLSIANADGSSGRIIGGGPTSDDQYGAATWSRQGRLAFTIANRLTGEIDLWTSGEDGSERTRVTTDGAAGRESQPRFDRYGNLLFLTVVDGRTELRRSEPDTSEVESVTGELPSGALVGYSLSRRGTIGLVRRAEGGARVWQIVTNFQEELVGNGVSTQARPQLTTMSWGPGEHVVFVADGECPTLLGLHLFGSDRNRPTRLTNGCRRDGGARDDALAGDGTPNALRGGGGADRLTALGGPDFVDGGPGDDTIAGGEGDDRLFGGAGRDVVDGGPGWDAIGTRDGSRDRVRCGPGKDVVRADRLDVVAPDCERVERS